MLIECYDRMIDASKYVWMTVTLSEPVWNMIEVVYTRAFHFTKDGTHKGDCCNWRHLTEAATSAGQKLDADFQVQNTHSAKEQRRKRNCHREATEPPPQKLRVLPAAPPVLKLDRAIANDQFTYPPPRSHTATLNT